MSFGFGFGFPKNYVAALFTPGQLFTPGVNGAWYDPSDFSTMLQGAAGTTPVTAVGQPVGLMLDKSKGLALGGEILTNGTFDSSIAGWTAGAGSAAWVAGTAQITGAAGVIARLYQGMTLTAGKWYRMTATCVSTTDVSATLEFLGGGVSTTFTAGQTKSLYFYPTSTGTFYAQVRNSNAGTWVSAFDNISVREIPGNHAFNSSGNSANFPVLQQDGTGRYYLAFNGVNQWLQTNSIDFTYGDKMFVSAGVRKLGEAAASVPFELSVNGDSNTGTFQVNAPSGAGSNNIVWFSYGTTKVAASASGIASPISLVMSGIGNISGPESTIRINGAQITKSTASQGAGNYGNYPLYIGARAGSSLFFNGRLYGLVVAGKQASASEITSTETYINQKTGAF